jgi:hypothetical protein
LRTIYAWARPRLAAWCAVLVASSVVGVVSVAPAAQAAGVICKTKGHAYLIKNGVAYFSNYEDERTNPFFTQVTLARGEWVQLAGNGIKPGTKIRFFNLFLASGEYNTTTAGSNCVVAQEPNWWQVNPLVAPGHYILFADYTAAYDSATDNILTAPIVDITVV